MEILHPYEQLMYDRFTQAILSWNLQEHPDICMIYVHYTSSGASADAQGNEFVCQGYITLHYQTRVVRDENIREGHRLGHELSDAQAAIPDFPDYGEDFTSSQQHEIALRDSWCKSNSVLPDGKDETGQKTYDETSIIALCEQACSRVGKRLHETGILVKKIGEPLSVVIETDDYVPDPRNGPVAATRTANPPGLSKLYEEQMLGNTYAQIGFDSSPSTDTKS